MAFDVFRKREDDNDMGDNRPVTSVEKESKSMETKSGIALMSEDVECKGTLTFSSEMEFNGRFEGEIHADGPLTVGEKAVLKAQINSKSSVVIKGKLQGNITAKDRVEIAPSAQVYGDITAPKVTLKEGAVFVGKTNTLENGKASADFTNIFSRLDKSGGSASTGSSSSTTTGASSSFDSSKKD